MSSPNSSITEMPSGPEEEDSLDADKAARSSAIVIGSVMSGESKSCETVATSSSSFIGSERCHVI